MMYSLIYLPLFIALYAWRGDTLPKAPNFKGKKQVSCALIGAVIGLALGDWYAVPVMAGAAMMAYLPPPDYLDRFGKPWFVVRMDIFRRKDKFNGRNMVMRHTLSGIILATAGIWFTPWALLFIPANSLGALGYMKRDNLLFAELVMGAAIGLATMGVYYGGWN
jgi:hypothetical protein